MGSPYIQATRVQRSLFGQKDNGEFVVLMFWEKAKQVQAWTDNPQHKDIVPEFMSLTTGPVDMDLYEIAYQIEV